MKKYWLVFNPDTFVWTKYNKGIVYNALNFKQFTFYCSTTIRDLIKILVDLESLYSVEIEEFLLQDSDVRNWVNHVVKIEAGHLIEQNGVNEKIVSYYPFLKIQDNKEHILWEHKLGIAGKIVQNLDELTFYLNGSLSGSDQFYKQTNYPLASNRSLAFEKVASFVKKCRNTSISKIVFVGDVLHYKHLDGLQKWMSSNEYPVHFIALASDINGDIRKTDWLSDEKVTLSIVADDYDTFPKRFQIIKRISDKVNWKFPVTSITQFELATSLIQKNDLKEYEIIPIFAGNNKAFFEENIFMTKEEFKDINLSRRQIFINMALNIHYFGKLTIMPDGQIYANVNKESVGDIDTPVYDMIFKEMTDGHSWLSVRDFEPCSNCVFQWLCPSPGNYEYALNKPNLCHVFRQEEKVVDDMTAK